MMSEFLKLSHFVDQHGMPEVQVRSRWIKAGLDPQWLAAPQFFLQIRLKQDFITSTLDQGHCIFFGNHAIYLFGDKNIGLIIPI